MLNQSTFTRRNFLAGAGTVAAAVAAGLAWQPESAEAAGSGALGVYAGEYDPVSYTHLKVATCNELSIHRSTLDYRLERLTALFGVNLADEQLWRWLTVVDVGCLLYTSRCV